MRFLKPERVPFTSVEIILTPIVVPEQQRDLLQADGLRACVTCGVRASFHFDGWDGNRLSCQEAGRRHGTRS